MSIKKKTHYYIETNLNCIRLFRFCYVLFFLLLSSFSNAQFFYAKESEIYIKDGAFIIHNSNETEQLNIYVKQGTTIHNFSQINIKEKTTQIKKEQYSMVEVKKNKFKKNLKKPQDNSKKQVKKNIKLNFEKEPSKKKNSIHEVKIAFVTVNNYQLKDLAVILDSFSNNYLNNQFLQSNFKYFNRTLKKDYCKISKIRPPPFKF